MYSDTYQRRDRDYRRRDLGWGEPRSFSDDGRGYRYGGRDNNRFGNRDEDRRTPRDETDRLIASNKVEGTPVYGRDGERLGRIENFMVGKRSGKVEYAVLSFGGFMGMGDRHYPLPWRELDYDERLGGYRVSLTERDLDRAPSHWADDDPRYERGYGSDINAYYGAPGGYW